MRPFFCEAKSPYIYLSAVPQSSTLDFQKRSFTLFGGVELLPPPLKYNVIVLFLFLLQVYIVGHIPPGSDERQVSSLPNGHTTFSEKNNLRYLRLVRKYSTIILGQFFGHLHSDSFRIIYNESGKVFFAYLLLLVFFSSCRFYFYPMAATLSIPHTQSKNIIFDRIKIPSDAISLLRQKRAHFANLIFKK